MAESTRTSLIKVVLTDGSVGFGRVEYTIPASHVGLAGVLMTGEQEPGPITDNTVLSLRAGTGWYYTGDLDAGKAVVIDDCVTQHDVSPSGKHTVLIENIDPMVLSAVGIAPDAETAWRSALGQAFATYDGEALLNMLADAAAEIEHDAAEDARDRG